MYKLTLSIAMLVALLMIVFNPWFWNLLVIMDRADPHQFVRAVSGYLRSNAYVPVMLSGHAFALVLGFLLARFRSSWVIAILTVLVVLASLFSIVLFAVGLGVANAR